MFRLFSKINRGLDPVSQMFKEVRNFMLFYLPHLDDLYVWDRCTEHIFSAACHFRGNSFSETSRRCRKQQKGTRFIFVPWSLVHLRSSKWAKKWWKTMICSCVEFCNIYWPLRSSLYNGCLILVLVFLPWISDKLLNPCRKLRGILWACKSK
jgi:hypothetical protein